jgi:hypothetical protein
MCQRAIGTAGRLAFEEQWWERFDLITIRAGIW